LPSSSTKLIGEKSPHPPLVHLSPSIINFHEAASVYFGAAQASANPPSSPSSPHPSTFRSATSAPLLLDPVDLRGLPYVGTDGSKWAVPEFLPTEGAGILFLDELNAAPSMVQAAFYQLVLDGALGEYTLPDGCIIVAAGNRDSDRAHTTRMPTPLRNRFVHLDVEVDTQEWSEWRLGPAYGRK
jgi:hypothetical protein